MTQLQAFWRKFIYDSETASRVGIASLLLRLVLGLSMFFGHGFGKISNFSAVAGKFPDPLGIGSQMSLTLTVGAEVFCALALVAGLATRYAAVPLMIAMAVAAFIFHSADPFGDKELAIVYLAGYASIWLLGSGQFSLDALISGKQSA